MRAKSLVLSLLIAGSLLSITTTFAQTAAEYERQIETVVRDMDRAVTAGLQQENVLERAWNISRNSLRWVVNHIPFVPRWEQPYGEIRREFFSATKLLREIAGNSNLSLAEKNRLIEKLAKEMGEAFDAFTEPYANPSDVEILDAWRDVKHPLARFMYAVALRPAALFFAVYRDARESIWPYTEGRWHVPDAMPFFGADNRRNRIGAGILRDAALAFRDPLGRPEKFEDLERARAALVEELKQAEPIRHAELQSFMIFLYTLGQVWFVINPQPELATEPTVLGPALSAIAYASLFQIFKQLRKSNAGYSVYRAYRRLNQPGTWWPGRVARNIVTPIRGGVRILLGGPCAASLQDIVQQNQRRSARRERLGGQ